MAIHDDFQDLASSTDVNSGITHNAIDAFCPIDFAKPKSAPVESFHFPRLFKTIHNLERRQSMPLDASYFYLRHLESNLQSPQLFKICNSINTIDVVLNEKANWDSTMSKLSRSAWAKVREQLFQILITKFSGRFLVFCHDSEYALAPKSPWQNDGHIEFHPDNLTRTGEFYKQTTATLPASVVKVLQRMLEDGKENICPEDFEQVKQSREVMTVLFRSYEICEQEAEQGKAKAVNLLARFENELKHASDRMQRKEIRRRILRLQTVWGV